LKIVRNANIGFGLFLSMYHVKTSYTNAKKQNYNNYLYDSKFEAGVAQDLDLRVKAIELTHYDRQVNLDLIVNDFNVCTYRIEIVSYHTDGTIEYNDWLSFGLIYFFKNPIR